jgi:hypothetical protein
MSFPIQQTPYSPYNLFISNLLGNVVLTGPVTLSTPTSATLITGLTTQILIPAGASYIKVELAGSGVTITAAATITIGAYTGATSGALTTQFGTQVRLGATGGTVCDLNGEFYLPVTPSLYNTQTYISLSGTASTGNFVTQAGATNPTFMVVTYY